MTASNCAGLLLNGITDQPKTVCDLCAGTIFCVCFCVVKQEVKRHWCVFPCFAHRVLFLAYYSLILTQRCALPSWLPAAWPAAFFFAAFASPPSPAPARAASMCPQMLAAKLGASKFLP